MRPQQPFGRRPDEPRFDLKVTREDVLAIVEPFRKYGLKKTVIGFVGLAAGISVLWHSAHGDGPYAYRDVGTTQTSAAIAQPAPAPPACDVTLKKYQSLAIGISLGEANSIIGCKANETQRVAYGGTQRVEVTWSGGFLSILDATFDNDRLVAKSQLGLE